MEDMYDAINSGKYGNKFSYPKKVKYECPECRKALGEKDLFCSACGANVASHIKLAADLYQKEFATYRKENQRVYDAFKNDALSYCGYAEHPKADLIFARAWEAGRSSGYASVLDELRDLCQFLDDFQK